MLLDGNSLVNIPDDLPPNLERLSLANNSISEITNANLKTFEKLSKLKDLSLMENNIKVLYNYHFDTLPQLQFLQLQQNPLV